MDFKLSDNDLKITNGDLVICHDNKSALAQSINIRLKTLKGEWFLDRNLGLPYLTDVFSRKVSSKYIRHLIISELEHLPGIKSIEDFNLEPTNNRKAIIKFNIIFNDQTSIPFKEGISI